MTLPNRAEIADCNTAETNVLTCVYCGHTYPAGTPASGSDIDALTSHIRHCEKHPLRKAEADVELLRSALVGLVGVDGKAELEGIKAAMQLLPAEAEDKLVTLNAIHALQATLLD